MPYKFKKGVIFEDPNEEIFMVGGKRIKKSPLIGPGNKYLLPFRSFKVDLTKEMIETGKKVAETINDITDRKNVLGKRQTNDRIAAFGYDPIIHAPL